MTATTRQYKTACKQDIANAYGFKRTDSVVKRIEAALDKLTDEDIVKLGQWKGQGLLLPDQVEQIVHILGTPQTPGYLYTVIN